MAVLLLASVPPDERADGERALAAAEAALDRADPGWRMADLIAARNAACPPDHRNLTKLCERITAAVPRRFDQWQIDHSDWLTSPPHLNRLPAAAGMDGLRDELAAADEAVRLTAAIRWRPTGGYRSVAGAKPIDRSLKAVEPARKPAALLEVVAAVAAADKDWPRAAAAAANILHLCLVPGDEPGMVPQFARKAVGGGKAVLAVERMIGLGEPPADSLQALQGALLAEADFPRLATALRGERAFSQHMFAEVDAGRVDERTLGVWAGGRTFDLTAYRPRLPRDRADLLNLYTELLTVARRPAQEWADGISARRPPGDDDQSVFLQPLHFQVTKLFAGSDQRVIARLRSAAAGLSCERYRQTHGRWPNDLAELKELLPAVPLDPYDGHPLRYRKLDDGAVVYAVGPDRQDDGGTLSYGQPRPGEDVGFRLWDVAARRQPAPAEQP